MKKFGFINQIAKRFISIIHKENLASIKVAETNGMKILYEPEKNRIKNAKFSTAGLIGLLSKYDIVVNKK